MTTKDIIDAIALDHIIRQCVIERGLISLIVPDDLYYDAQVALAQRISYEIFDLKVEMIGSLHDRSQREGISWRELDIADHQGKGGRDWDLLVSVAKLCIPLFHLKAYKFREPFLIRNVEWLTRWCDGLEFLLKLKQCRRFDPSTMAGAFLLLRNSDKEIQRRICGNNDISKWQPYAVNPTWIDGSYLFIK